MKGILIIIKSCLTTLVVVFLFHELQKWVKILMSFISSHKCLQRMSKVSFDRTKNFIKNLQAMLLYQKVGLLKIAVHYDFFDISVTVYYE